MTNILGKIAQTLGLDGEDRNTNAAAAGHGGVGGTPDDLAVGAAAAAADKVAQATGGTDPLRSGRPDGSIAAGGQSTAGTDPIEPGQSGSEPAPRSHDLGGGSSAA
jgi:hypothetical protein